MVFMYVSLGSIQIFSKNRHHMHLYMTVILHNAIRVNVVVQSFIIYLMHLFVYWNKNTEQAKLHERLCLGSSWEGVVLLIMPSKLLQMIFHNV